MKKALVIAGILLIPYLLRALGAAAARTWAPVVQPPRLRVDGSGNGAYGSPRGDHSHEGVDLLVLPGQQIFSPFEGVVTRVAMPYADDSRWLGLEIAGSGVWEGFRTKVFYIEPVVGIVGQTVGRGDLVGYAQDISRKYGGDMKDHIHVELWNGNTNLDPTALLL